MKLIPFLLLVVLISCGSGTKPLNLKNAKPGNLQFFETYTTYEIAPSWKAACEWINDHDTLAQKENTPVTENPRGLNALVQSTNEFMLGYVNEEHMSEVNAMLAIPEVKAIFPKDVQFMWSYGVEEIRNDRKMYALYAIKVPSGNKALIDGRHIEMVKTAIADYNGMPVIRITMNQQGAHDWELMTRKNIGRTIAITIDNQVLSCPVVNDAIAGGETEISGNFSKAEAEDLAARIYKGKK